MPAYSLVGFFKWETPDGDVRLCDGGILTAFAESYASKHATFGTIAGFDPISEGVGDEVPAGTLTFSPAVDADPADYNYGGLQGSRIRFWIGEYDAETGLISGTPELKSDSIVDVTRLRIGRAKADLEVDFVSRGQRLFLIADAFVLSGEAHRRIYPTETGLNNAIGVPKSVAWGIAAAPRGTTAYGGGGAGGGGGGGGGGGEMVQYV